MRMYSVALAACAVGLLACDQKAEGQRSTAELARALSVGADAATAPSSLDPEFLGLLRKARDAARKLASQCELYGRFADDVRSYYDVCTFEKAEVAAMLDAAAAVGKARPDAGVGLIFAEHVRLFAEWIALITKDGLRGFSTNTTGTLSHYQELAGAWNSLQPNDRVPVDVGNPVRLDSDFAGPLDGGAGVPLPWQPCSLGRCVTVTAKRRP